MADISLRIGDTAVLEVSIYKNEQLLDLNDFLVLFTVKSAFHGAAGVPAKDDKDAVITKHSELDGGIEKVSGSTGLVRINIDSLDSKEILDGEYLYDVQISKISTADTVITVDSGTITFQREITTRVAPLK